MSTRVLGLLLVLATVALAATDGAGAADPCANPTIRARSGGIVKGTGGNDVILGSTGADIIYGRGGDDVICGGGGADTLFGDSGADRLYGGADGDTLNGGDANDRPFGEAGGDSLDGGAGDRDRCDGGSGADSRVGSSCELVRSIP